MVTVKLNLTLIEAVGKQEIILDIDLPVDMDQIIKRVGLDRDSVGMIIRNGRWISMDCTINEGDLIEIFPHLEGG